jgi:hypothetical protein
MIHISRKLVCTVSAAAVEAGTAPKNMKTGKAYHVLGYQTETKIREVQNRAGEVKGEKKVEEISGVFVINDSKRIQFAYASVLIFRLDKEEIKLEAKTESGETQNGDDDLPF